MSTELDDVMLPAVLDILNTYGVSVTLRREVQGTYDPMLGTETTADVITDYTVTVSPPDGYKAHQIDGTAILAGDVEFVMAGSGAVVTPDPATDKIIHNSVTWGIVSVESWYSGDDVAAFALHCRRVGA